MDALVSFSDFVEFPLKCHKVTGLILEKQISDTRWNRFMKVFHVIVKVNMFITFLTVVKFFGENIDNLMLITEHAPSTGSTALGLVKLITLSWAKEEFLELMSTLMDLFPKTKEEKQKYKVRKYLDSYKRLERAAAALVIAVVVIFTVSGLVWGKLPFMDSYPFDTNGHLFYFSFIWEIGSSLITIASLVGPDFMLFAFITLIQMQFDILCIRLRELKECPVDEALKKLVELVKFHDSLLKMTKSLERIYSVSILINLVISSALICLMEFQVVEGIDAESVSKFLLFLAASLNGIFLLCYFGEKLTAANDEISDVIYDLEWYEKDNQKLNDFLLMMMLRSQRSNSLSAGKFFDLSLVSFTLVS